MDLQVDLHIHSNRSSDGDFSPHHIIQLAKENKIKAISIADHDTLAAYPEALDFGKEAGVEVIPSVELTTLFNDREFHLLLPFINWQSDGVTELVLQVAKRRLQEAEERVARLKELGFSITWEEVLEESRPFPPLGVTIAQILLRKAKETQDHALETYYQKENTSSAPYLFYRDYFVEGKPAYVPRRNIDLLALLEKIGDTGGVPVLAHPGAPFQRVSREDLEILKDGGLAGLEVYTSYHNSNMTQRYNDWAEELDLVPTAGSDFHGSIKPQVSFGSLREGGYWMVERLRERRP